MHQPLALQPLADARLESVSREPCSSTPARIRASTVLSAPSLEDHRLDAMTLEQTGEQETGWPAPTIAT